MANTAQRSDWFFTEAVSCENRDRERERRVMNRKEKSSKQDTALRSASEAPLLCVSVSLSHVGPSVLEAFCSPSLRRPPALLILLRHTHAHTFPKAQRRSTLLLIFALHRATPRYTHTHTQQISALAKTPKTSTLHVPDMTKLEHTHYKTLKMSITESDFLLFILDFAALCVCCFRSCIWSEQSSSVVVLLCSIAV